MSSTNTNKINVATYKWVIANFSNYNSLYTPTFGFPIDNGAQFALFLNPSLHISYCSTPWSSTCVSISVYLYYQDSLKVKHRMSIVNTKGDKCNTQEGTSIFKKGHNLVYNIPRDVLMHSGNGLLVNDTLTIVCEIELLNEQVEHVHFEPAHFSTISQHYESLLESGKHSDVVLAIGQNEIRAHKLVLCARSPVFAAMFDHSDTKEAQQGRVDIVDVAVEVFQLFVRYLYTDKIDQLDRFAPELLTVADMYQMDGLKSLCEHFLCSTLAIDNVSQLLIHADLYRAEVLKCKCIDYITDNSEMVQTTQGWKELYKKNDLLALLFANISIKLNSVSK